MDTSRVHRQPATTITPLSIAAAETADDVPEGCWVAHTAIGTCVCATYRTMCHLTFFNISASGMWVGGTPWGGYVFHGSELSYLSPRGVNPGSAATNRDLRSYNYVANPIKKVHLHLVGM